MPHPKGGYDLADGTKAPSVTTIIGRFKESRGLVVWAWKQGKAGIGLNEKRDEAATIGTLAHGFMEAHIKQIPRPPRPAEATDEMMQQAETAFGAYLSWESFTKLKVISLEESMICEHHRYGGTPDGVVVEIEGRRALLDFKTSNSVYTDFLYQIAAYGHLYEDTNPWLKIDGGYHLIQFGKEHGDFAHHFFPNLDDAWNGFLLMRQLYEIDYRLKKRVK